MIRQAFLALALSTAPLAAQTVADMAPRDGWEVLPTTKSYDDLVAATKDAVAANGLAVVTGNRVIGAFNNVFAVRILEMSTAAMIEAPIRLYVTENTDGTATLSYKRPSTVFAPYMAEAGGLDAAAAELDTIFAAIAAAAGG
jgi:uncharacterized protein (DUF302 family)